ncbi:T9SS type A sorting domain-containing protein [candidate division KSB1 bacterium]|nr:T9SS type A sorting domain-containing protein [candidate division KSB1 bacterium]
MKISDVSLGEHILKATATDSDGGQNTTAPLRVHVVESTKYFNTEGLGNNYTNIQNQFGRSPQNNQLLSIYPNPFNPSATVYYEVPNKQRVNIQIYNLRGQYIATLVDKQHIAGKYSVIFKGDHLQSGIYLCRMNIQNNVLIKKITLIK